MARRKGEGFTEEEAQKLLNKAGDYKGTPLSLLTLINMMGWQDVIDTTDVKPEERSDGSHFMFCEGGWLAMKGRCLTIAQCKEKKLIAYDDETVIQMISAAINFMYGE